MFYLLSPIENHPDFGFGITADAYYMSAEGLKNNDFPENRATQQKEMPQSFLFRHAIELYLKSLIIIFHKTLEIDYGHVPFDSNEPEIQVNDKWIKLYRCHYIDELYEYWLKHLLLPNKDLLEKHFPMGTWDEPKEISEQMSEIVKYDQDSSYFRYPVTKNSSLDTKKHSLQPIPKSDDLNKVIESLKNTDKARGSGNIGFVKIDENDKIVEVYAENKNLLVDVRNALSKVSSTLYAIHIMVRCTLCGDM